MTVTVAPYRPRHAVEQETRERFVVLPPPDTGLRAALKHPKLMHHNRLAALVGLANLGFLAYWLVTGPNLAAAGDAAIVNLALAIGIRQHYVVNLLFWLATRAPVTWPLKVRWTLAKVYHFGGIHIGGAVSGTGWFLIAATGSIVVPEVDVPVKVVGGALMLLLLGMVVAARPGFRAKRHDLFERAHRFGGWTALALFWAHTVLSIPGPVTRAWQFWVLVGITVSIALPWLRLRKVDVHIERPSNHVALARFDYGVTPFAGSSTAISRNPLKEWHSFANVPEPGRSGFRLTISRAGDWTGKFIDDAPAKVWVKGIPTAGVANIETLFRKVVYVATGSGIGPCLPHLLAQTVPARLVWATRTPRETYGDALVDEILAVQPDALIWDTSAKGKPDMVALAYAAYLDSGAEAVICISNKKLTWQVVHGLELRGIPSYGAIWDS